MKKIGRRFRRFIWACTIGFMIAWHNVYFQDDRLREETTIEIVQMEEDLDATCSDPPTSLS